MQVDRNSPFLWMFLAASPFFWCASPMRAQQPTRSSDDQMNEAIEQAVSISRPSFANQQTKTRRRQDLEEDLSKIVGKPLRDVHFYDMESPAPSALNDDAVWAVVTGSTPGTYKLYSFEGSQGFDESSQEFDRLISQLMLSIPNEKAASLAQFFLGCCVRGEVNEDVLDEEGLRHAVQRYYLQAYGDVWRTLEAYTQWWDNFQENPWDLAPTVTAEGDGYRIALKRVRLIVGTHPQLQEWNLVVSRRGAVRALSVQPIFPKKERWLSYDFRSTIAPASP
jgi:hypothetical protein